MKKWLASKLASIARRLYPIDEQVMSFYGDRMVELIIHGKTFVKVTHIDPEDIYEEKKTKD